MEPSDLSIEREDPSSPDGAMLIGELSAELGERYGDDGGGDFEPEEARTPGSAFLVARLDGRPVACGALRPFGLEAPHAVEIRRMYVRPEMRGQHMSRSILAALEKAARASGYTHVRLETGLRQPEAIRLYISAGYSRIPRYGRCVGNPLSACFEKTLGKD